MNTFGHLFRITTFGESHGGAVGCVIDGCPAGIPVDEKEIEKELQRRAPGRSDLSSGRKEMEKPEILSGVFEGRSLGTPIAVIVRNTDARSEDYEYLKDKYRPSHADFTYEQKFGVRAWAGGGRASARETVGRVIAGVVAKKVLASGTKAEILAYVSSVHEITASIDPLTVKKTAIEKSEVRCPDEKASKKMSALIREMKGEGDSVGGIITGVCRGLPAGIGDPVFEKLDATLAQALMSIPAVKGVEIGSGFSGTLLTGKSHNDEFFRKKDGSIGTTTNNSGGIQGGISNGEAIIVRVAFKPTATIQTPQKSVDKKGNEILLDKIGGRHDPCVLPRAVPIVEAMMAVTIADHYLRQKGMRCSSE